MLYIICTFQTTYFIASGFANQCSMQTNLLIDSVLNTCFNIYTRQFFCDIRSGDMGSPDWNIDIRLLNEMYIAEQSCSWIPTTALLSILKTYCYFVVAFVQSRSNIAMECIVAIWPEAHFLSIHIDFGFAHCAIKEEEIVGRCS